MKKLLIIFGFLLSFLSEADAQNWPRLFWSQIQAADTIGAIPVAATFESGGYSIAYEDSLRWVSGLQAYGTQVFFDYGTQVKEAADLSKSIGNYAAIATDGTILDITAADLATNLGLGVGSFTAGSVLFADTDGSVTEDNANLFWDNSANELGIGTNAPATAFLHVVGTSAKHAAIFEGSNSSTSAGTGDPQLELVNSDATTNNWSKIHFADSATSAVVGLLGMQITDHANNYGNFYIYNRSSSGFVEGFGVIDNGSIKFAQYGSANKEAADLGESLASSVFRPSTNGYLLEQLLSDFVTDINTTGGIDADLLEGQAGSYYLARTNHTGTQLLSTISDVDATEAELDVLDLSATALTIGWVYAADGASAASWRQLLGSEINNDVGWTTNTGTVTSITAGSGLAGGTITTSGTIDLDINSLAVATIAAGDFVPFWDITATATNKKITFANFEATLNHDNLAGFVANEHLDWTQASVGTIHATNYVDNDTQLSQEEVEDFAGGMWTGNTETLITVTYQDADGTIDAVVENDLSLYDNTTSGFVTASGFTAGSVIFSDGANFAEDNSSFYFDDASNELGIRTTSPAEALHVQGNVQIGNSSVTTVGNKIERSSGGVTGRYHFFIPSTNTPHYQEIFGGNWTSEGAGNVINDYTLYFDRFGHPNPSVAQFTIGFITKVGGGAFTSTDMNEVMQGFADGGLKFNYFGVGNMEAADQGATLADYVFRPSTSGDLVEQALSDFGPQIDAGMVDGFNGSQFLRSDANDTTTGDLTVDQTLTAGGGRLKLTNSGPNGLIQNLLEGFYLQTTNASEVQTTRLFISGDVNNATVLFDNTDRFQIDTYGSGNKEAADLGLTLAGYVYRPSTTGVLLEQTLSDFADDLGLGAGAFTAGSVLFGDTDGSITEDNSNLFFDNSSNELGIRTTSPAEALHVQGNVQIGNSSVTSVGNKIERSSLGVVGRYHFFIPSTNTPQYSEIFGGNWTAEDAGSVINDYTAYFKRFGHPNATVVAIEMGFINVAGGGAFTSGDMNAVFNLYGTGAWKGAYYGSGNMEDSDLSKTHSSYMARFATDGTIVEQLVSELADDMGVGDLSGFTAGSVLFHDGTSVTEDNANFFWDDANNELGIGTNSPGATFLHILGTSAKHALILETPNSSTSSGTGDPSLEIVNSDATNNNWAKIAFTDSPAGAYAALFGVQITDHVNNYGDFYITTRSSAGYSDKFALINDGDFRLHKYGIGAKEAADLGETLAGYVYRPSTNGFLLEQSLSDFEAELFGFTAGSILFGNTDGTITQDNAILFFDNSNNEMGIGTNSPGATFLHILGTSAKHALILETPNSSTSSGTGDPSLEIVNSNATNNNWAKIAFTDSPAGAYAALFGVQITDHTNNYGDLYITTRSSAGYSDKFGIISDGDMRFHKYGAGNKEDHDLSKTHSSYMARYATDGTLLEQSLSELGDDLYGFVPGSVLFADGSGNIAEDNGDFFWDSTNDELGIGTSSPAEALHVVGGNTILTGSHLGVGGALYNQTSAGGAITLQSATRVALELYTSVADADNEVIGEVVGWFSSNTTNHDEVARIQMNTDGGTATQRGGEIVFSTKPNGSTTLQNNMIIRENGEVGVGTTTPDAKLDVELGDGNPQLRLTYNGSNQTDFEADINGRLYITPNNREMYMPNVTTGFMWDDDVAAFRYEQVLLADGVNYRTSSSARDFIFQMTTGPTDAFRIDGGNGQIEKMHGEVESGVNSPAQITGDQNNYDMSVNDNKIIRISSDASRTITGIVAPTVDGTRITVMNVGSNPINFSHDSASSSAANRIYAPNATTWTLNQHWSCDFWYDGTSNRWRIVAGLFGL